MISVCMTTYNGESYLKEQISSILSEIHPNDELIISDDGSTDNTCSIIESFKDSRIILLHNKGEHGVNKNFENSLRHAKGDLIFLSDQDDVWIPGKVKACKEALMNHMCVVHDAYITNENLDIIENSFFNSFNCKTGFIHNLIKNGYLGCAMAFHKDILNIVLPIPTKLPVWHDIWIGSLSQLKHEVVFIPFKGIKFRRHNATTSITTKGCYSLSKKISYRMSLLWHLYKRLYLHK